MADRIRVLLTEEEVDKRINEVAAKISEDYAGKQVHMICILKGGVFFTCELAKRMTVPVSLDFMSVAGHGHKVRCPWTLCPCPATAAALCPAAWSGL